MPMKIKLQEAKVDDVEEIAALRNAVSDDLTAKHGKGSWTGRCTERGVLFELRNARLFAARHHGRLVGTLVLATKKPWAIDRSYFTPCARPLYLTAMAVAPECQRQGIGRACLAHAVELARDWPADAVCLDAYDAVAGAGEFYRKCGFQEVGRASFRDVPLLYFEHMIAR
jgi:GNAT superfamily N-acetyltransferase